MKANEYMSQLKSAFPKADAIYEDTIIDICGSCWRYKIYPSRTYGSGS